MRFLALGERNNMNATHPIRFIGDVHGKYDRYKRLIAGVPQSIQVGDMGVGFRRWPHGEARPNPPFDAMAAGDHRFIRGNHDNPRVCKNQRFWITDGHIEDGMMFIGGAVSTDKEEAQRVEDYSWWPDEELSTTELNALVDKYIETKPRIMVTHDCPEEVASIIGTRVPAIGMNKLSVPSRTRLALQEMWVSHYPNLWIFGHYHMSFDHVLHRGTKVGTRFVCLSELEYRDLSLA
jgi:hypothetical protein